MGRLSRNLGGQLEIAVQSRINVVSERCFDEDPNQDDDEEFGPNTKENPSKAD
jgi:hypothetical protein